MPNHTDVRAIFFGPADHIQQLLTTCRIYSLKPDSFLSHWNASDGAPDWSSLMSDSLAREPEPLTSEYAGMPPIGPRAPFTLNAGITMPASMNIEESSSVKSCSEILEGHWRSATTRHPEAHSLRSCKDQESATAWAQKHMPKELAQAITRQDNIKQYGCASWYDWSVKNWGTKWDAYDTSWSEPTLSGRMATVRMQTAWSPPLPALSAMCEKFKLQCCCSYIDEGGGFADYCVINDEGLATESGHDFGQKQQALIAETKRVAKRMLRDSGLPKTLSKKTNRDTPWTILLSQGSPLTAASLASPKAPPPRSEAACDALLSALAPDAPCSPALAAEALDSLFKAGVISPEDRCSAGVELGFAFAVARWRSGLDWALKTAGSPEFEAKLVSCAMWQSLESNDPSQAVWAYERLGAAQQAAMDLPALCKNAPETALALAFILPRELGSDLSLAAAHCFGPTPDPYHAERAAKIAVSVEQLALMAETPKARGKPAIAPRI